MVEILVAAGLAVPQLGLARSGPRVGPRRQPVPVQLALRGAERVEILRRRREAPHPGPSAVFLSSHDVPIIGRSACRSCAEVGRCAATLMRNWHTSATGRSHQADSRPHRNAVSRIVYSGPRTSSGAACSESVSSTREQLTLLVPEMALHDCRDAIEVTIQLDGRCGTLDRGLKAGEQVRDHRVVLGEPAEHGLQLRVGRLDRREQGVVLAPMVSVKGRAEPVAVQQQVTGGRLAGPALGNCSAGVVERLA